MTVTKKINIEIAGISTCLLLDDGFYHQVETACLQFRSDKPTEYILRVNIVNNIPQNRLHNPEVSIQDNKFMIISEEFAGYMDLGKKEGEVNILPDWTIASLANFLRNLYSALVLSEGGLMLHAAGVAKDSRAYIFFGPSGSGKSTVARASSNYSILTDDLVAIRLLNGSFRAYGTPYWADGVKVESGINGSFKIGGLFKLIKDKEVYLNRLSYSQAIAEILTVPKSYESLSLIEKLLNFCMSLAKVVPCYELHFLPNSSFWRCIDEHLS